MLGFVQNSWISLKVHRLDWRRCLPLDIKPICHLSPLLCPTYDVALSVSVLDNQNASKVVWDLTTARSTQAPSKPCGNAVRCDGDYATLPKCFWLLGLLNSGAQPIPLNPLIYTRHSFFFPFFILPGMWFPRTTLALPPSSDLDPRPHSGPSSPPLRTVRAFFIFIPRKNPQFLPSRRLASNFVPTHAAGWSQQLIFFFV